MSRAIVAASAVPKKAAATIDPIPTYEICITLFPSIEVNRRSPKRGDDLGIFQGIGRAERRSINAPVGSINRLSRRRTADGVRQAATSPKPLLLPIEFVSAKLKKTLNRIPHGLSAA
jgi:hypothetical protein